MLESGENWSVEDELSLDFSFLGSPEKKQRVSVVKFESKLTYNGNSYTRKSISINGEHAFYRCMCHRGPHFCKADVKYTSKGDIIERNMDHSCGQNGKLKKVEVGSVIDVSDEMKQLIVDSCNEDATKSASDVAKIVSNSVVQKYEGMLIKINSK
jgi:FLYWCH zinc finger domain